jgi:predicted metal-dependent peptidase
MEITLETVRSVLMEKCGTDSFLALFIQAVGPDERVDTACIDEKRTMRYNPKWVEQHIKTREHLFFLVMHELMHRCYNKFYNTRVIL